MGTIIQEKEILNEKEKEKMPEKNITLVSPIKSMVETNTVKNQGTNIQDNIKNEINLKKDQITESHQEKSFKEEKKTPKIIKKEDQKPIEQTNEDVQKPDVNLDEIKI